LILQSNPKFPELSTSVGGGLLRRICQEMTSPRGSGKNRPRTTLALDEFKSLGKIEEFDKACQSPASIV
jgi:type IV secretory pathway TraG/TraD family ATPase VirD4